MIVLFLVLSASCIHTLLSGTKGPEVIAIGITGANGFDVRITCVHGVLMLCSGALLKGSPYLPVVPLRPRCKRAGRTKDVVQVLIASTYDYIWNTCLGLSSTWMLYLIYLQLPYVLIAMWIVLSMQRPSIHPYAYRTRILLFTTIVTSVFILLLLLLYYCYSKTVATDKLLWAILFPGAAELTTQLLRLINILWLPFVESINWVSLPSKILWYTPYTCGSSRLFSGAVSRESIKPSFRFQTVKNQIGNEIQIKWQVKTPIQLLQEPTLHNEEVGGLGHHVWVYVVWHREDISWVHRHYSSFKLIIHEMKI